MSQYTSTTTTASGLVVNAILDTETGQTTYTVTTPSGASATKTVPNGTPPNSSSLLSTENLTGVGDGKSGLFFQLTNSGANDIGTPSAAKNALASVTTDVAAQAAQASATATVTGNPPPAESQAIPVSPVQDPEVAYYQQLQAENEAVAAPLTTPPGTDEYDSLQSQIDANTTGLQEPPVVSDEEYDTQYPPPEPYGSVPVTQESLGSSTNGVTAAVSNTQGQSVSQNSQNINTQTDWRVRLQLAAGAKYLYNDPNPGILTPLVATQGVLFPYTPSISVNYAATYDNTSPTHSNYKIVQYQSSAVDSFSITCDFTAQDVFEANYLLAVIHFFRSVTKMFYGQDQNPINGTPPPLCFLTGMGAFNFDQHPLVITNFTYTLPTDVDYIPAGNAQYVAGQNQGQTGNNVIPRYGPNIVAGGKTPPPSFSNNPTGSIDPTYVPTKMSMTIQAMPIVSRNDISNNFSLKDYGSGKVYRGSTRNGAGIW